MPVADLNQRHYLLAGGGPSAPDDRVLRALTTSVIGQFDPEFTRIMDEVMELARATLLTRNQRCFPVTGFAEAALEAVFNTLLSAGDSILVLGSPLFVADVERTASGYGIGFDGEPKLAVVPHLDPYTAELQPVREVAATWHERGVPVLVEATSSLGGVELRTDEWGLDVVVAGVDYCLGAPSGMALVTYSDALAEAMEQRATPPRTSYLDLLQLQAYWSPERLNHHTAPTSLVYGLREALRLLHQEGLAQSWARHMRVAEMLVDGLRGLGFGVTGSGPMLIVQLTRDVRQRLLDDFGIYLAQVDGSDLLRVGLLGADATPEHARAILAAVEQLQ